ncbi:MAG: NosD domain-containing protein, partial [archaeon]
TKTSGTNIVGGPYLGGNFWAKPDGTGFSETCNDNDHDGICDSSHDLATDNIDYLPLTFSPICYCDSCATCNSKLSNPSCRTVKLTTNISDNSGTCISDPENFSNKVFDCQGYTIDGSGYNRGIYLNNKQNNTIKNCIITEFIYGIYLDNSSNNVLINNNNLNNGYGIYLYYSSNNTLINNTASSNNNYYGIYLRYSSNNTLINNTANSNRHGILLEFSSNNTLVNNTMNNNRYNFGIYGDDISHYYQDINTSNTVDGKPIYYWTNEKYGPNNCKDTEIDESTNAGFVALVGCDNITVKNLNLSNNIEGILLVNTTNSRIINNNISSNYGIFLFSSSNNTVTSNNIFLGWRGVQLNNSHSNAIFTNHIILNDNSGVYLSNSANNTFFNNFFNNTLNVEIGNSLQNFWNTTKTSGTNIVGGPYLGGNFWAKPDGTGFSENSSACNPGSDRICTNAYIINVNNTDYLPLTIYAQSGGGSGGSGGGGYSSGGGGYTSEGSNSYNFTFNASDIFRIDLNFSKRIPNPSIQLIQSNLSHGMPSPDGIVYGYYFINMTNFNESDISSAHIEFRVSLYWINENKINESTITLYRYENGRWNPLPTSFRSKDNNYAYYLTRTNRLSLYAIVGKVKSEVPAPSQPTEEEKPSQPTQQPTQELKQAAADYSLIIVVSILIIAAAILAIIWKKK